jgi:hypothetical protein
LGTEPKVHSWTFRMDGASDPAARMVFNLGLEAGDVTLDDVRLVDGLGLANRPITTLAIFRERDSSKYVSFFTLCQRLRALICLSGSSSRGIQNSSRWSRI